MASFKLHRWSTLMGMLIVMLTVVTFSHITFFTSTHSQTDRSIGSLFKSIGAHGGALVNSELASSNVKQQGNPSSEICLVALWDGSDHLPPYVATNINSLLESGDTAVAMYLFMSPRSAGGPGIESFKADIWPYIIDKRLAARVVHAIDVGQVSDEWKYGGIRAMYAATVCKAFGVANSTAMCQDMYAVTAKATYSLIHARTVMGKMLSAWIGPSKCRSWAWVDLDVYRGSLAPYLTLPQVKSADVWTIGSHDMHRVYTRGQFTAFRQDVSPARAELVNTLFRHGCDHYDSMASIINAINSTEYLAMDEGCMGDAVIKHPDIAFTVVRGMVGENPRPLVARIQNGLVASCFSADGSNDLDIDKRSACEEALDGIFAQGYAGRHLDRISKALSKAPTMPRRPFAIGHSYPPNKQCSSWLRQSEQWCRANPPPKETENLVVEEIRQGAAVSSTYTSIHGLDIPPSIVMDSKLSADSFSSIRITTGVFMHVQHIKMANLVVEKPPKQLLGGPYDGFDGTYATDPAGSEVMQRRRYAITMRRVTTSEFKHSSWTSGGFTSTSSRGKDDANFVIGYKAL
ncbi:hypothetical protein BC831DRAFT_439752 [Entophlyctis helioformis]|nr:hypothetical protein BC831DRAFT_439752 [Entophlyctis helioformis]